MKKAYMKHYGKFLLYKFSVLLSYNLYNKFYIIRTNKKDTFYSFQ